MAAESPADCFVVIDSYKRITALEQLGRDTVEAVVLADERGRGRAAGPLAAVAAANSMIAAILASAGHTDSAEQIRSDCYRDNIGG